MRLDVLSLFPGMFEGPFTESMIKRARDRGIVQIEVHDIRDFTHDAHRTADDYPYGGGAGMVLKPEPIFEALDALRQRFDMTAVPVVLLSPQGRLFSQAVAHELARHDHLAFICGHYEGVDERVCEHAATDQLSIGDYVLTSGEIAAIVVIDAVVRLLPGVLGSEVSLLDESYSQGLLEYPQYTRPAGYRGYSVPEVLLSGDHARIARWRHREALLRTARRRPDLLVRAVLNEEDRRILGEIGWPNS